MKYSLDIILCLLFYLFFSINNAKGQTKIILFIGDGMGMPQISYYNQHFPDKGILEAFTHTGFVKTAAYKTSITDSAASATAYSCGVKTYNGFIGMDISKNPLTCLFDYAYRKDFGLSIIVTDVLMGATPASFYAHHNNRRAYEDIAMYLLDAKLDIAIGGGKQYLSQRKDKKDLLSTLSNKGYKVITELNNFNKTKLNHPTFAVLQDKALKKASERAHDFEKMALGKVIDFYTRKNKENFFILQEGSQIDWAGHGNDSKYLLDELKSFFHAVAYAIEYAKENDDVLILLTADHETGGLSLVGSETKTHAMDNYGISTPHFSTLGHSAVAIPIFAFGKGAEKFTGFMDNTAIFIKIKEILEQQ